MLGRCWQGLEQLQPFCEVMDRFTVSRALECPLAGLSPIRNGIFSHARLGVMVGQPFGVKRRRLGKPLGQLLLLVVMGCLGFISYVSLAGKDLPRAVIPALTMFSLISCLYVIAKERSLKKLQAKLVRELLASEGHVEHVEPVSQSKYWHVGF